MEVSKRHSARNKQCLFWLAHALLRRENNVLFSAEINLGFSELYLGLIRSNQTIWQTTIKQSLDLW